MKYQNKRYCIIFIIIFIFGCEKAITEIRKPEPGEIKINEVVFKGDNEQVELYNVSNRKLRLDGCFISDGDNLRKINSLSIEANEYKDFSADKAGKKNCKGEYRWPKDGEGNVPNCDCGSSSDYGCYSGEKGKDKTKKCKKCKKPCAREAMLWGFSKKGEVIILLQPDKQTVIDFICYKQEPEGKPKSYIYSAIGRYPNGSDNLLFYLDDTIGKKNSANGKKYYSKKKVSIFIEFIKSWEGVVVLIYGFLATFKNIYDTISFIKKLIMKPFKRT